MKISIALNALLVLFAISCTDCKDEPKTFTPELFPTVRRTFYDWDKVDQLSGDTIYFGVGTKFFTCKYGGQEELEFESEPIEFYTDQEIIIGNDTIFPMVNLLKENKLRNYICIKKETDAFFNSPQYLIQLDNKNIKLHDYYTFYFKGFTVSGAEIKDSTIVFIK